MKKLIVALCNFSNASKINDTLVLESKNAVDKILRQLYSFLVLTTYISKFHLNVILLCLSRFSCGFFLGLSIKLLYSFSLSHTH